MPASQMMGFKRRREPFCDGKTFFDDAALKAALGGCAASPKGGGVLLSGNEGCFYVQYTTVSASLLLPIALCGKPFLKDTAVVE